MPSQDAAAVAMIRSEFADDPDMTELVDYFVQEMPDRVATLAECWRDNRLADLRQLAAQLRASSGGYGFPGVTEAAAKLERSLEDQSDLETIRAEVESLIDLCRRVSA